MFMADIKQMFRQILIRLADRDYLRILWRFSSISPNTRKLAIVDKEKWPKAASVLWNDTFVDDIITGSNSTKAALEYQF